MIFSTAPAEELISKRVQRALEQVIIFSTFSRCAIFVFSVRSVYMKPGDQHKAPHPSQHVKNEDKPFSSKLSGTDCEWYLLFMDGFGVIHK